VTGTGGSSSSSSSEYRRQESSDLTPPWGDVAAPSAADVVAAGIVGSSSGVRRRSQHEKNPGHETSNFQTPPTPMRDPPTPFLGPPAHSRPTVLGGRVGRGMEPTDRFQSPCQQDEVLGASAAVAAGEALSPSGPRRAQVIGWELEQDEDAMDVQDEGLSQRRGGCGLWGSGLPAPEATSIATPRISVPSTTTTILARKRQRSSSTQIDLTIDDSSSDEEQHDAAAGSRPRRRSGVGPSDRLACWWDPAEDLFLNPPPVQANSQVEHDFETVFENHSGGGAATSATEPRHSGNDPPREDVEMED
jgi:hypothetical protein